jgi:F420-dependent oxidoreductase-like protein
MELGLHYWNFSNPSDPAEIAATLTSAAEIAEQEGLAEFSVVDHFFQMEHVAPAEEPMLEAYATLAYVAARTKRIRLAALVTGVLYRYPGVLAKVVTTLDVLSGGRAQLGLGASWYEREQRGLGVPVVPVRERFERLEETLQICLQMWSDNNGPYRGNYYELDETLCNPLPLTRPRPPILVGGGGEFRTLLLVARYADACNLIASNVDEVAHKLAVLRTHCEAESRDYDAIRKTAIYPKFSQVLEKTDLFLAEAREYAALGISQLDVLPDRNPVEYIERVAHLVPVLAAL